LGGLVKKEQLRLMNISAKRLYRDSLGLPPAVNLLPHDLQRLSGLFPIVAVFRYPLDTVWVDLQ